MLVPRTWPYLHVHTSRHPVLWPSLLLEVQSPNVFQLPETWEHPSLRQFRAHLNSWFKISSFPRELKVETCIPFLTYQDVGSSLLFLGTG